LIEVSRGSKIRGKKGVPLRNSVSMKELPERKYANYKPQMAPEWRLEAAQKFLERPDSTDKLKKLFDVSGYSSEQLEGLFWKYYKSHQKAVIVPAGTVVVATETKASRIYYSQPGQRPRSNIDTDIDVGTDIYTFKWRSGSKLIYDVEDNW
jgi:hypothetical protein